MMVHDNAISAASVLCHRSPQSGDAQQTAISGADKIELIAVRHVFHSKQPDAEMMRWFRLNAERNIGFSATVSVRALKVEGISLVVLFNHDGMSHQRIGESEGPSVVGMTTPMVVGGAMLYRGSTLRAAPQGGTAHGFRATCNAG
jgi:hypothetical protein